MRRIFMTRHTEKGLKRYYKIELFGTLFGEFVVEREYGNLEFKSPTGVKKDFFNKLGDALLMFENILIQKKKKGYKSKHE